MILDQSRRAERQAGGGVSICSHLWSRMFLQGKYEYAEKQSVS